MRVSTAPLMIYGIGASRPAVLLVPRPVSGCSTMPSGALPAELQLIATADAGRNGRDGRPQKMMDLPLGSRFFSQL